MLSVLRSKVKPFARVLAKPFVFFRIDPNLISVFGLVLALIGAFFVTQENWLFALVFFVLAPTMDLIDGEVARSIGKRSNWGNYFETMIDKFVDFVMIGSFVFIPVLAVPAVLALGFSMISSYAKPRVALIIITDNHDWPAIGEHADKLIIILVALLLAALGMNIIGILLYFIAIIGCVGSLQRIAYAKKLLIEAERKGNLLPYIKKKKER